MVQYLQRIEAVLATRDAFLGKPLSWGKVDCLHLVAFCLKQLGHRKPTKGVRKYSSQIGAIRAMKASGFTSLVDAVDAYGLTRIPPAMAMAGDVIAYASDDEGFGGYALGVAVGDNKFLGMAPHPHCCVDVAEIWAASYAWRAV